MGLVLLVPNYLQICYNSFSLQQWYQFYEGVLSFSFVFLTFVAILKKNRYILAVSGMVLSWRIITWDNSFFLLSRLLGGGSFLGFGWSGDNSSNVSGNNWDHVLCILSTWRWGHNWWIWPISMLSREKTDACISWPGVGWGKMDIAGESCLPVCASEGTAHCISWGD